MRPITSRSIFGVVALASVAFTENAGAASTYFIDESTAYAGSCSNNENLNVVSASLKTAMDARSFTGARYVNSSAISGDFTESCSPSFGVGGVHAGLDSIYGDSKSVVVFAGHGGAGFFYFQTPWWGQCYTQMSSNMRLGAMSGSQATVGIWLSCDSLSIDGPSSWDNQANSQWLQQQFGFNNTISIGDNEARDFFNATNTSSNVNAWINKFNNQGRGPVAISYGDTSTRIDLVHNSARMYQRTFLGARGGWNSCQSAQPGFWWKSTYVVGT